MKSVNGKKRLSPLDPKPRTSGYKPVEARQFFTRPRDLPMFSFLTIDAMDMEPTIVLAEQFRMAKILGLEFAFQTDSGDWQPGVKADNPEVAKFVLRQFKRIWSHGIDHLCTSQTWGWSAAEVMLRLTQDRSVEVDRLLGRHARDVRALESEGQVAGVRFMRLKNGEDGLVDIPFRDAKAVWCSHNPEPGAIYGQSIRFGAYSPWADKWLNGGALDTRRLFAHKDAYGGVDMTYPDGFTEIPDGQGGMTSVPNQNIAQQITEQIQAGGVTTRPSDVDPVSGKQRWELTRATIPSNPTHIFDYPKDLDNEMLRGMGVPDEILIAGDTGAWAGRRIPMSVACAGLDVWATHTIRSIDEQCVSKLVAWKFGAGQQYEVTHKPLAEQEAENQGEMGGGPKAQSAGGFQPPQDGDNDGMVNDGRPDAKRMGLDPIEAVGQGVLSAVELVKAARRVIRMNGTKFIRMGDFKESEHPRDDDGKFKGDKYTSDSKPKPLADEASQRRRSIVKARADSGNLAGLEKSLREFEGEDWADEALGKIRGATDRTKKDKKRTILKAAAELESKGYELLGGAEYDIKEKSARYRVKDKDGKVSIMTSAEIEKIVNGDTATSKGDSGDNGGMKSTSHHAETTEAGKHFTTGKPVTFTFIRNTESAPKKKTGADDYQQEIEPSGRYMLHDAAGSAANGTLPKGWISGEVSFNSPLVLKVNTDESGAIYSDTSWKAYLTTQFHGLKGKRLSTAIAKAGYDGIVTVDKYGTSEIVDLTHLKT